LGRIYQAISWDKLIKSLKLRENHRGRSSQFSPQGKLALKIPTPRTKYLEQKEKYFAYMRMRKKPWIQTGKTGEPRKQYSTGG
jgi:hypothetical protein